jgi:hypothetical protein
MYARHDFRSLIKQRHEEVLLETQDAAPRQAHAGHSQRRARFAGPVRESALPLLRRTGLSE